MNFLSFGFIRSFIAYGLFVAGVTCFSTLSAQRRAPLLDPIDQCRNNAKIIYELKRAHSDIYILRGILRELQEQQGEKALVISSRITRIQNACRPLIELFNQEHGVPGSLSLEAAELAHSLVDGQGVLVTQKLSELLEEHGIPLLFAALLLDEQNNAFRNFFEMQVQDNDFLLAVPGAEERQIGLLHLIVHLVKHQQVRLEEDFQENYSYFSSLAQVIQRGRADLLAFLLDSGILTYFIQKHDHNLLVKMLNVAVIHQQTDIVKLLLKQRSINLNNDRSTDSEENHRHDYRVNENDVNTVVDINRASPLLLAVNYYVCPQGQRCLDALLGHPTAIISTKLLKDATYSHKNLALQVLLRDPRIVKLIHFDGTDNLIYSAAASGNPYALRLFLKHYRKKAEQQAHPITSTSASALMQKILNEEYRGASALMRAIIKGNLDCVGLLLSQPEIVIDKVSTNGGTALTRAAQEIASLLAQAPSDDPATEEERQKKIKERKYIVDALLGLGKDYDIFLQNQDGKTLFHYLSASCPDLYEKYMQLYVTSRLTPEESEVIMRADQAAAGDVHSFIDLHDFNTLHQELVAGLWNKGILQQLKTIYKLAVARNDLFQKELLREVIMSEKIDLLKEILERYTTSDTNEHQKHTVLIPTLELAIEQEKYSCIKVIYDYVVKNGIELPKLGNASAHPLLFAARNNHPRVVDFLLQYFDDNYAARNKYLPNKYYLTSTFSGALQKDSAGNSIFHYLTDTQQDKILALTQQCEFCDKDLNPLGEDDIFSSALYETLLARLKAGDTEYLKKFLTFSYNGDLFTYYDHYGYHYKKEDLFYDLVLCAAKTGDVNLVSEVIRLLPRSFTLNYNKKGIPLLIMFFEYIYAQINQGATIEQWLSVVRMLVKIPGLFFNKMNILPRVGEQAFDEYRLLLPACFQELSTIDNSWNIMPVQDKIKGINMIFTPLVCASSLFKEHDFWGEILSLMPRESILDALRELRGQ